jgi:hypothetical protein
LSSLLKAWTSTVPGIRDGSWRGLAFEAPSLAVMAACILASSDDGLLFCGSPTDGAPRAMPAPYFGSDLGEIGDFRSGFCLRVVTVD